MGAAGASIDQAESQWETTATNHLMQEREGLKRAVEAGILTEAKARQVLEDSYHAMLEAAKQVEAELKDHKVVSQDHKMPQPSENSFGYQAPQIKPQAHEGPDDDLTSPLLRGATIQRTLTTTPTSAPTSPATFAAARTAATAATTEPTSAAQTQFSTHTTDLAAPAPETTKSSNFIGGHIGAAVAIGVGLVALVALAIAGVVYKNKRSKDQQRASAGTIAVVQGGTSSPSRAITSTHFVQML